MESKKSNPFKDETDFEKELESFAYKHRITIAEHSKRISDYFEMSCYSMILKYYELKGFSTEVYNLIGGKFRFKCSPSGLLGNFSYFKIKKDSHIYRVYHNASIQSTLDEKIFTTPDIVVAKDVDPIVITDYYNTKKKFSYIPRNNLQTFCEAKHYNPFPELIFNFLGTVLEFKPSCLKNRRCRAEAQKVHIAPSLMMSGSFSKQTNKIKESLEKRYMVNILGGLFVDPYSSYFCNKGIRYLTTLGEKGTKKVKI